MEEVRECSKHGLTTHVLDSTGRWRCKKCRVEAVQRRRDKIKEMVVTDNTIIESATPKYPELMSSDAEDKLKKAFYNLRESKSKLSKLRMEVIELETKVKKEEESYRNISDLFEITFAKKEIQEIKNTVNMGIINPSDYRNTNI